MAFTWAWPLLYCFDLLRQVSSLRTKVKDLQLKLKQARGFAFSNRQWEYLKFPLFDIRTKALRFNTLLVAFRHYKTVYFFGWGGCPFGSKAHWTYTLATSLKGRNWSGWARFLSRPLRPRPLAIGVLNCESYLQTRWPNFAAVNLWEIECVFLLWFAIDIARGIVKVMLSFDRN